MKKMILLFIIALVPLSLQGEENSSLFDFSVYPEVQLRYIHPADPNTVAAAGLGASITRGRKFVIGLAASVYEPFYAAPYDTIGTGLDSLGSGFMVGAGYRFSGEKVRLTLLAGPLSSSFYGGNGEMNFQTTSYGGALRVSIMFRLTERLYLTLPLSAGYDLVPAASIASSFDGRYNEVQGSLGIGLTFF